MKPTLLMVLVWVPMLALLGADAPPLQARTKGEAASGGGSAGYFRLETAKLSERCLADIRSLQDWEARRAELRRQLQEMLGLWPMPQRTPLNPVITGKLEREECTVEKLYFEAMPRLYVTANLYLPKKLEKPAPAILYVCGHSRQVTNGISCGNKAGYQHHGAWFARNGYVCLMIDSLELGEIEGQHRGTSREDQWWWNARGYSPAGVEAWFGLRALDYLCSRAEVDQERIGMTGRSGGGSYTWTVAALDERVKVAAPVAGITDLQNQVVDGAVEGHCDCMFFVNTYRWDFPQVAALLAPRPLLIANSDKDSYFPLDGVVRLYNQTRRIYQLYGQGKHLGLLITEGPHVDTQDLQVPVFRWFNRFLNRQDPVIEMAAKKFFAPEQLRVFDKAPGDEVNAKVQEQFVPQAPPPRAARTAAERAQQQEKRQKELREQVFAGWPSQLPGARAELCAQSDQAGARWRSYALESQPGVNLRLQVVQEANSPKLEKLVLVVLDAQSWSNSPAKPLWLGGANPESMEALRQEMQASRTALAFFAPRDVEPAAGLSKPAQATHLRRQYMLLGQTQDSMRVWDIRCAALALKSLPEFRETPLQIRARGPMGINAAYAALFEPTIARVELEQAPRSHMEGPDYLNVLKVWDIPQLLELLGERAEAK